MCERMEVRKKSESKKVPKMFSLLQGPVDKTQQKLMRPVEMGIAMTSDFLFSVEAM